MLAMEACAKCNQSSDVLRLVKCVLCFKMVCENCALRRYAKLFCSDACAKTYYFDTDEPY